MLLSLQGKCGQGDPLECHRLRSIDILGIRSSLALQVTQCQIQIHQDPPFRFPRLSKCQESTVHDIDCDDGFGGYNRSDGIGCTKCDVGSVVVKNITEKTIANRSSVQRCLPCPDNAKCNVTTVEMWRGCLVRKSCGAKELCAVFPKASLMLGFWFRTVGVYSEERGKGAWRKRKRWGCCLGMQRWGKLEGGGCRNSYSTEGERDWSDANFDMRSEVTLRKGGTWRWGMLGPLSEMIQRRKVRLHWSFCAETG